MHIFTILEGEVFVNGFCIIQNLFWDCVVTVETTSCGRAHCFLENIRIRAARPNHFLENIRIHAANIACVARYWKYRGVGAFVVLASQATIQPKVSRVSCE